MPRAIHVRFFATARVALGRSTIDWPAPAGGVRVRELVRLLAEKYPGLGRALRTSRFLRNGEYISDLNERVRPGDELAVHPPYGGG